MRLVALVIELNSDIDSHCNTGVQDRETSYGKELLFSSLNKTAYGEEGTTRGS